MHAYTAPGCDYPAYVAVHIPEGDERGGIRLTVRAQGQAGECIAEVVLDSHDALELGDALMGCAAMRWRNPPSKDEE